MKKLFIFGWLLILAGGIAALFWYSEWVYSLPTPIPAHYRAVPLGRVIDFPMATGTGQTKPVFLHFFNPDCPCSRFNIEHVRSLIKKYEGSVDFKIVLVTDKKYSQKDIQDRFNVTVPVITDSSLASTCGVYSTPQAVILDNKHQLYYRGNYNRSRYCTDKKTNYAQAALELLLNRQNIVVRDPMAIIAYGCRLPGCPQ